MPGVRLAIVFFGPYHRTADPSAYIVSFSLPWYFLPVEMFSLRHFWECAPPLLVFFAPSCRAVTLFSSAGGLDEHAPKEEIALPRNQD